VNTKIAEAGKNTRFKRGTSPNLGGRPKKTPYTDACRQVAEMFVKDLKLNASDPVPVAIAKMVAREALKGKVAAAAELANRVEGAPTQRHELGGLDGMAVKVEAKLSIWRLVRSDANYLRT
jgi:hypothetical protein